MNLRVLSLNIWKGGLLFDEAVGFLRDQNADVVLLQEIYNGADTGLQRQLRSFTELSRLLGYEYSSFAPAFREVIGDVKVDSGNVVFSRFPITESNVLFFDIPYDDHFDKQGPDFSNVPRIMQYCVLDTGVGVFHAFNVHGIWGFVGTDNDRRLAMGTKIIDVIGNRSPMMLAGDFNVNEGSQTISMLQAIYHDPFQQDARVTSFNMRHKNPPGTYGSAVVDMMMFSPDVTVLSHAMPIVDVSDHLPLVCDITL